MRPILLIPSFESLKFCSFFSASTFPSLFFRQDNKQEGDFLARLGWKTDAFKSRLYKSSDF